MARVQNPIIGQTSGQAGGMIFSGWKQLKVMRSAPLTVANPNTPAQQAVRGRMKVLGESFRAALNTIKLGFATKRNTIGEWARFIQLCFAPGTEYDGTVGLIVPTGITVAQGQLLSANDLLDAGNVGQAADLEWNDNSGQPGASASDIACVVAYDQTQGKTFSFIGPATRADAAMQIVFPIGTTPGNCNIYFFFSKADGTDASDSQHVRVVV